jgi:MoaA/NifB/PqqE/SkfB family radical SAM enzyme
LCELIDRHKSESEFIIEDDYYKTFIATSNPDESAKHANFKGPMQPGKNESEYNECADYSRRILNGETLVFRVRLDIARMCNFKCQFCCSSFHLVPNINKNNQIIPLETIRKLSVQFKKLGVRHVNLYGGGEPTLHPQFAEVLEILAENDFRFQLITNGSGLNSIVNNTIVKHHSKFDTIRISLPGLSVRSHRFATKSISYNKITAHAQELIKEIRCYPDIPQIGLYVPVMGSFTEEEIDSFLNFAITARFDWVFFREDFRFPAVNSVQEFNPIREHQAVRELVTKVSARYPGFRVFYSTPIIVPNKSSICYFQLTDRCLSFDPQSKKLIVVNCEHHVPARLNDFPPDGTYELIVPDSFYEICKNQVQFFSSKNNLPCPRPDFCYTSRRNDLIDHKLKAN